MRPQKVQDSDIMVALTRVFRTRGYEGASLSELAEATGLKKASLYHRFPKGKQEMAAAVLGHLGGWLEANVFQALSDKQHTPSIRLKNGLSRIQEFYEDGRTACIFRALSMQSGHELFEKEINAGMRRWIEALEEIGAELELPSDQVKAYAMQTLIDIQGSLIVAKGLDDTSVFVDTMQRIENRYLRT